MRKTEQMTKSESMSQEKEEQDFLEVRVVQMQQLRNSKNTQKELGKTNYCSL